MQSFFRFLCGGGLATLSHWACMWLLISVQVTALVASVLGALVGALVNYWLQYHFTFQSSAPHRETFSRYAAVMPLCIVSNALIFYCLFSLLGMNSAPAQITTTTVVALLNYFVYAKGVFYAR